MCRTLQLFKQKKVGAKKGYELLKKKADALKKQFREIMIKILDVPSPFWLINLLLDKTLDGKGLQRGHDRPRRCKLRSRRFQVPTATPLVHMLIDIPFLSRNVQDQVKSKSTVRLAIASENVAGVHLPVFTLRGEEKEDEGTTRSEVLTTVFRWRGPRSSWAHWWWSGYR